MNRIIVNRNIISNSFGDGYIIDGNMITFNSSGEYEIEYVDCSNVSLIIMVMGVDVNLLEISFDNSVVVKNNYIINGGLLQVSKFYNNKRVLEEIKINLKAALSRIDYNFSNICMGEEDYKIDIIHECEKTVSNISNKAIVLSESKINFEINSMVNKEGIGSLLNQNTRIVTMGECYANIKPNMFIDLEDVEAKHGSVIGTFKDEQVFYLMSKGIPKNTAIKLLIKGYILGNIVVNLDVRKKIMEIIDKYWR